MKKAVLLLFFFALACNSKESGNKEEDFTEISKIEGDLTRDNVENLVRTGLKENPIYGSVEVPYEFNSYEEFNQNKPIQQLVEDGVLKYDTIDKSNYWEESYSFRLDLKHDKYKKYRLLLSNSPVASYKFEFDSLISVREIPQMNMAEVKVRLKKSNDGTPFKILDSITPDEKEMSLGLYKEIDGWVYGGDYRFELQNVN